MIRPAISDSFARLQHKAKLGIALISVFCLADCASGPKLIAAGDYAMKDRSSLRFDRDWTEMTDMAFQHADKTHYFSIDGDSLNLLILSEGLSAKDPFIIDPRRGDTSEHPAPHGHDNMSLSEQMEFVVTNIAMVNYKKIETHNPKPITIDGAKGVRFEIVCQTVDGLKTRGLAQAVTKNGLSHYALYLAPKLHYYDTSLKKVTTAMDSLKIP